MPPFLSLLLPPPNLITPAYMYGGVGASIEAWATYKWLCAWRSVTSPQKPSAAYRSSARDKASRHKTSVSD